MKPFEIFRTGSHTSLNGQSREFSETDLDSIASSYNPEEHEAPIVIGHPDTNAPAYGWIEKLQRVGDKLIAFPKQVSREFSELVKNGAFKKRSISITPDLKLNHVGFLGAAAPAVKGLKDVEFAENPDEEQFASFELEDLAEFEEESINASEPAVEQSSNHSNNQSIPESELTTKLQQFSQELSTLKSTLLDFAEKGLSKEDLTKIHQRIDELRFSMQTNEFELMLNEKLAYGSITPAMKTKIQKIVNFLQRQNFASGDFSTNDFNKQVAALFTEFIEAIPQFNLNGEFATKGETNKMNVEDDFGDVEIDSDQLKIHRKAIAVSKEKNISYLAAVKEVVEK